MGKTTPLTTTEGTSVGSAVAPQDRAASLFQAPRFIDGVTDNSKRVAPGVSVALPKGAGG